jgi:hypothetical protein
MKIKVKLCTLPLLVHAPITTSSLILEQWHRDSGFKNPTEYQSGTEIPFTFVISTNF